MLKLGSIFFSVSYARIVWRAVGVVLGADLCPFEIVFSVCTSLIYWACLQKEEDMVTLRAGAELLSGNTQLMRIFYAASQAVAGE